MTTLDILTPLLRLMLKLFQAGILHQRYPVILM